MKKKWGIFGGTFDPFHMGHLNSLTEVYKDFELEKILVIPTYHSPFRPLLEGPEPEQRFEMVQQALDGDSRFEVHPVELHRKGTSYTVDTLTELKKAYPDVEFHLVIGIDQFERLSDWKDYGQILEQVHLIVTSRPGFDLPEIGEELPSFLEEFVDGVFLWGLALKDETKIFWHQLSDVDVSGTELRRKMRMGESVSDEIPAAVLEFIQEHQLYESLSKQIEDFFELTEYSFQFVQEKGGIRPLAFDLRDLEAPSEFTIVVSGTSTRQTIAMAETLARAVKTKYGVFPQNSEGLREGRWVVLDYGSLIVHFFYDYVREEYRLEELWRAGKLISFSDAK